MVSSTRPLTARADEPHSTCITLNGAQIHLRELPSLGKTIVRLGTSAQRGDELTRAAGISLVNAPGEVAAQLPLALWRGPLEWLVLTQAGSQHAEITSRLRQALGEATSLVADFSDALSVIELAGDAATSLLAKGCAVDISSWPERGAFCVPAACARVPVLVHRQSPGRFWLHVDRSLSRYMWEWLCTAATEFEDSSALTRAANER
ncbi:MAG: sarcosine oxidase subunit gamma [Steroidobacteraceae bacterium]